jgi:hypothetical protein
MTITEALQLIRRVGVVESDGGNLKVRFPEEQRSALQTAIDILRSGKAEALALLAEPTNAQGSISATVEPARAEPLESVLKDRAIELWSGTAGRLFLVADEEDASRVTARLNARGGIYTAAEVRRIVAVRDPAVVAEIHRWKREFDGVLRG